MLDFNTAIEFHLHVNQDKYKRMVYDFDATVDELAAMVTGLFGNPHIYPMVEKAVESYIRSWYKSSY